MDANANEPVGAVEDGATRHSALATATPDDTGADAKEVSRTFASFSRFIFEFLILKQTFNLYQKLLPLNEVPLIMPQASIGIVQVIKSSL